MRVLSGLWARLFRDYTIAIADAPADRVITIRGTVVARDLMDSPLAGTPCVYYRYRAETWRQSRVAGVGGDGFWELSETDEAIVEFYLADATGRAIISPTRARVSAARGLDATSAAAADPAEAVGGQRRARELLIEPGDEVTVTGEATQVADLFDDSRNYRQSPERLMLQAPDEQALRIRLVRKRATGTAAG